MIYCNNTTCQHYDNQQCKAANVYYVDRRCVTYKRAREPDYRQLMRTDAGLCKRSNRRMKRRGR